MGNLIIRSGLPSDHDAAIAVWRTANIVRRGGRPPSAQREAAVRGSVDKPDAFMVIAEEAGEVVGMAVGMQGLDADGAGPPIPGYCHITAVFVAPYRWGKGIGGRTVDAVLAEARARNYDYVRLWTHADNERA